MLGDFNTRVLNDTSLVLGDFNTRVLNDTSLVLGDFNTRVLNDTSLVLGDFNTRVLNTKCGMQLKLTYIQSQIQPVSPVYTHRMCALQKISCIFRSVVRVCNQLFTWAFP